MIRRILVVEDDASIVLGLRMNLQAEGYEVATAGDGVQGLELARDDFDLLILDLMLPGLNGFEVLKALRREDRRTPVIVLSARTSEADKVTALELGAEDYVTKPFGLAELLARVRVVLRRLEPQPDRHWRFGDVVVEPQTREVHRAGEPVELTRTEFEVLSALWRASGRILSRDQIFEAVWGPTHHGTLRTIDNFVAQLRQKLEDDPANPRHFVTVRGVGYRFIA